jgi:Tfp pilus assembly pilus retraction ATPase PilT
MRTRIATLWTSLRGVISQQLLQRADGEGRVAALEILINTPASQDPNIRSEHSNADVGAILVAGSSVQPAPTRVIAQPSRPRTRSI